MIDRKTALQAVSVLVAALGLLLGGTWLFSVNEFKAPPARVVAIPEGFIVLGEETSGGSGGTNGRWVAVAGPEGMPVEAMVVDLVAEMESTGWEVAEQGPVCCGIRAGDLGFLNRGDEWAALKSRTSLEATYGDLLGLGPLVGSRESVVFVLLEYTDWGQGRRYLFN